MELDAEGVRKKKWQWTDLSMSSGEHVHAPPFQSITYTLNSQIAVKLVSQEKINIDFIAENQICKFRINVKPKPIVIYRLY